MIPVLDLETIAVRAAIAFPPSNPDANLIPQAAIWKMRAAVAGDNAGRYAEQNGAPDKVVTILKSAVSAGTLSGSALSVVHQATQGYLTSLRQDSAFMRMLADGLLVRTPMRTRCTIITGMSGAGGTSYSEGEARKLSSITISGGLVGLVPVEVSTTIAVTQELLDLSNPAGADLIQRELKAAVAEACDARFLSIVAASVGLAATSSGATLAACLDDLFFMLGRCDTSSRSKLVWIGSPSVAKALSVGIAEDATQFPQMSALGGTLLGLPFFTTGGLSDGAPKLYLIDAGAIAADATSMDLIEAKHASIQFNDAPDSPETTSTTIVSLWQHDMVGLKAVVYMAVEVLRANSAVQLSDIAWATSSPDSP